MVYFYCYFQIYGIFSPFSHLCGPGGRVVDSGNRHLWCEPANRTGRDMLLKVLPYHPRCGSGPRILAFPYRYRMWGIRLEYLTHLGTDLGHQQLCLGPKTSKHTTSQITFL